MAEHDNNELKTTNMTRKAGLSLNVNLFKTWIKNYFKSRDEDFIPQIKGFHVGLSAISEVVCLELVNKSLIGVVIDDGGLYNVGIDNINRAIKDNLHLNSLFRDAVEQFDEKFIYTNGFCIPPKIMKRYLELKITFNVYFTKNAFNYLIYLMTKLTCLYTSTARVFMSFTSKKTIGFNALLCVNELYLSGNFKDVIDRHLNDTKQKIANMKDNIENNADGTEGVDLGEEDEETYVDTGAEETGAETDD